MLNAVGLCNIKGKGRTKMICNKYTEVTSCIMRALSHITPVCLGMQGHVGVPLLLCTCGVWFSSPQGGVCQGVASVCRAMHMWGEMVW
jgi:hypothetical protein